VHWARAATLMCSGDHKDGRMNVATWLDDILACYNICDASALLPLCG